jgi:hypothetical protein
MVVALKEDTHLLVYGWIRHFPDPNVKSNVGDAIIFRRDLIHAGGAYEQENIRLHAYPDVVGVPRPYNKTFPPPSFFGVP